MEGELCSTGASESRILDPEDEAVFDHDLAASLQKLSLGRSSGDEIGSPAFQ